MLLEEDPEIHRHLVKKYNVYKPEDKLIKLVRANGSGLNAESINKLFLSDPGNSIYAKSLVKSYKNVIAADQFFQGKTDLADLRQNL
jgi:hypothetical protein